MNDQNYKSDFIKWVQKEQINVVHFLPITELKTGDFVDFTNDYGVTFEKNEILGFCTNDTVLPGNVVYLNKSSYWFPVKLNSIKLS